MINFSQHSIQYIASLCTLKYQSFLPTFNLNNTYFKEKEKEYTSSFLLNKCRMKFKNVKANCGTLTSLGARFSISRLAFPDLGVFIFNMINCNKKNRLDNYHIDNLCIPAVLKDYF